MIFTVTLNPAADNTITVPNFRPGSVNRAAEVRFDPGGKGVNVSKLLQALGVPNVAMGFLGGEAGNRIEAALQEMGMETAFTPISGETRTNNKIIDPVSGETTDVNCPGPEITAQELESLKAQLKARVHGGDTVVFSGSLPAGVPEDFYRELIRLCRSKAAKTYLDTSGPALKAALEAKPYALKPNLEELCALTGKNPTTSQEVVAAARALSLETGANVTVSMGKDGAVMINGLQAFYAKAPHVEVCSTVGAGDSMVAALVAAEETGLEPRDALALAIAAGSAATAMPGSSAPAIGDVLMLAEQVDVIPVLG